MASDLLFYTTGEQERDSKRITIQEASDAVEESFSSVLSPLVAVSDQQSAKTQAFQDRFFLYGQPSGQLIGYFSEGR